MKLQVHQKLFFPPRQLLKSFNFTLLKFTFCSFVIWALQLFQTKVMLLPACCVQPTHFNKASDEHLRLCVHWYIIKPLFRLWKNRVRAVIKMSDWKQMSDCRLRRQRLKCEVRTVIKPWTLNRWGAFIQLHNPTLPPSYYRFNNETTFWNDPPRWPWKAHRFPLNLNSAAIASKPDRQLLHTTSKWRVGPRHLISPLWRRRSAAGEEMKDSREGGRGARWTGRVWILNA